jgi:hypothetical protein
MDSTVDGSLPLEDQRRSLSATEQAGPYLLVSFSKGKPKPTNFASFNDAPLGQDIPTLILIEIEPQDALARIKAQQAAKGKSFIFCSPVYVEGVESTVAGFR